MSKSKEHRERAERMDREAKAAWKAWNMTAEEKATLKAAGISGHDSDLQRGPISRDESPDIFATISAPESPAPEGTTWVRVDPDGTETVFDSMEATLKANAGKIDQMAQRAAFTMAADMVREAIELMTRSKLPGLARAAKTLVLATKKRSSMDHQIQAELAREYGLTRAAVNKDINYIRASETFGPLCEFMFSTPEQREECSKHTSKSHAENKRLCETPPANSLAGMVSEILKTA